LIFGFIVLGGILKLLYPTAYCLQPENQQPGNGNNGQPGDGENNYPLVHTPPVGDENGVNSLSVERVMEILNDLTYQRGPQPGTSGEMTFDGYKDCSNRSGQ
jgi:hypothetical protein